MEFRLNNELFVNDRLEGPLVSVLMPFYKGGKFIEYALISIMNQTFQNFEIVLVDNNATPESRAVSFLKNHVEGTAKKNDSGFLWVGFK